MKETKQNEIKLSRQNYEKLSDGDLKKMSKDELHEFMEYVFYKIGYLSFYNYNLSNLEETKKLEQLYEKLLRLDKRKFSKEKTR